MEVQHQMRVDHLVEVIEVIQVRNEFFKFIEKKIIFYFSYYSQALGHVVVALHRIVQVVRPEVAHVS